MSASRLSSAFTPPPTPITARRPSIASASRSPSRFGAPISSSTTSNGPASTKSSGSTTSATECGDRVAQLRPAHRGGHRRARSPSELDRRRADPAGAPCTSSRSPASSPACRKTASCAVVNTSANPPASGQSSAPGTGIATRSCTTASSACPPAADERAHAVSLREAFCAGAAPHDLAAISMPGDVGGPGRAERGRSRRAGAGRRR